MIKNEENIKNSNKKDEDENQSIKNNDEKIMKKDDKNQDNNGDSKTNVSPIK